MPVVECPSCKKAGPVPVHFTGKTIRCIQCGIRFQVGDLFSEVLSEVLTATAVDGGSSTMGSEVILVTEADGDDARDDEVVDASARLDDEDVDVEDTSAAVPDEVEHSANGEQAWEYKVLTQKDKWFSGDLGPAALERAINVYARQGWRVKAVTTANFPGFVGGNREQLIVVLER